MNSGALAMQLSMETGMYLELQSVLEEEQKAVIQRDYQGLYKVISKKEGILRGLCDSASSRALLISEMLKDGHVGGAGGLRALIESQSGAERRVLQDARDGLFSARERVTLLNRRNRLLLSASLGNLGRALGFLKSFFMAGTYLSTGLREGKSLKGTRLKKGV